MMEPATNVFTLLPGAARPSLTLHAGAACSFILPVISSRLSLQRITPTVDRPASLSPMYVDTQLHEQILSSPLIEIVMMSGFSKLVATVRASLKRSTRRLGLMPVTFQAMT